MTVKETAEVLEEAKEVVEDAVDILEDRVSWLTNPKTIITLAALAGFVGGGVLTYQIASKRISAKWQKMADEQIEDVKNHYSAIHKGDTSLEEMAAPYLNERLARQEEVAVAQIMEREGYTSYDQIKTVVAPPETPVDMTHSAERIVQETGELSEEITRNIFESDDPDAYFDFEEELARREAKPLSPFVITKEEFDQGDEDYQQQTLTYYDGDDVLADEADKPCDIDITAGYENLLRFGAGSGDKKIVYIRNAKLEVDFEVCQSEGKFAKEVLGFDDGEKELRHSARQPVRRFRDRDE